MFSIKETHQVQNLQWLFESHAQELLIVAGANSPVSTYKLTETGPVKQWPLHLVNACGHKHWPDAAAVQPRTGDVFLIDGCSIGRLQETGCIDVVAGTRHDDGLVDGLGTTARFKFPCGLAFDPEGDLLVCDSENNKLRRLWRKQSNWHVETIPDPQNLIREPMSITYNRTSNSFLVSCYGPIAIVSLSRHEGSSTFSMQPYAIGAMLAGRTQDGPLSQASFHRPCSLAVDQRGNVVVCQRWGGANGNTLRVISSTGHVTSFAVVDAARRPVKLGEFLQPFIHSSGKLFLCCPNSYPCGQFHLLDHGGVLAGSIVTEPTKVPPSLRANLWKHQQSGHLCDVTFVAGGEAIKAHRLVLVSTSEYFETMLSGAWDTQGGAINIGDTTAAAFRAVLRWLYTEELVPEEDTRLTDVLQLAKQYLLPELEVECGRQLEASVSDVGTAVRLFVWADQNSVDNLRAKARRVVLSERKELLQLPADEATLLKENPDLLMELLSSS